MAIRFGMNVIYVRDLQRSIDFYRALGLDIPDAQPDRPVSVYKADGFTMIITTKELASTFDSSWSFPEQGYQQVMEFLVDDDASIDELWARMTAAGYTGRTAPGNLIGPYATLIEDPDGNVVLISNDPVTNA